MSEERPAPAQALYGEAGPISDGPAGERTKALIESGRAQPDPRFLDERAPPSQPERGPERRAEPAFDPSRYQVPDGYEAHPELMREFSGLAREFGLSQKNGERALDFYRRATEASEEHYARQLAGNTERLARELPPEDVRMVQELINDPALTPAPMRDWILRWGSHEAVATMLTKWAAAIRDGRRY
jgi:hypothetical protein